MEIVSLKIYMSVKELNAMCVAYIISGIGYIISAVHIAAALIGLSYALSPLTKRKNEHVYRPELFWMLKHTDTVCVMVSTMQYLDTVE